MMDLMASNFFGQKWLGQKKKIASNILSWIKKNCRSQFDFSTHMVMEFLDLLLLFWGESPYSTSPNVLLRLLDP